MQVYIRLTAIGINAGPLFDLYADMPLPAYSVAFAVNVTPAELLAGNTYTVTDGATNILIRSTGGVCDDYIIPIVLCTTTTTSSTETTTSTSTSSTSSTTTTSTTVEPIPVPGDCVCMTATAEWNDFGGGGLLWEVDVDMPFGYVADQEYQILVEWDYQIDGDIAIYTDSMTVTLPEGHPTVQDFKPAGAVHCTTLDVRIVSVIPNIAGGGIWKQDGCTEYCTTTTSSTTCLGDCWELCVPTASLTDPELPNDPLSIVYNYCGTPYTVVHTEFLDYGGCEGGKQMFICSTIEPQGRYGVKPQFTMEGWVTLNCENCCEEDGECVPL